MAQDSLDYSKTYIAFDSGCGECSAISHSLEQETNGKLLARPLSDPEVEQIRINHFGPNPPHIPVAITFNRTTPKVYSGPRLVALMARRFGPTTSLLLARIIGVHRNNEHLASTTPHAERRFFSRRAALQSAAGLAAVATIATIHTRVGSGVAHALEPKPLKSKTSGLDQPSIDELMQELSEDSNTRAALAALDLDLATSLPRSTSIAQKGLRGKEATEAGQRPDAPEAMQSEFARTSFSDGSHRSVAALQLPDSRFLVYTKETAEDGSTGVGVEIYRYDQENDALSLSAASVNGRAEKPTPAAQLAATYDAHTARASKKDPCGGCAKTNYQVSGSCQSKNVMQCLERAAGCATCAAPCASSPTGAGIALCLACAFASCGPALRACCSKFGAPNVCVPCMRLP